MISGIKDLSEKVALKRGVSKTTAEYIVKDVLDCLIDLVVEDGGFSYRGQLTIKQKTRKGKSGKVNGKEYKTEDKNVLAVTTGKELEDRLNK